jgi:hypothetical protein
MPARWGQVLSGLRSGNVRVANLHESKAAVAAYRGLRRTMSRLGLHVVVRSYYSPIPEVGQLTVATWEQPSELAGINFDLEDQLVFLEGAPAAPMQEFRPSHARPAERQRYFLDNGSYGPVDADVLYGIVRATRPAKIVELGSGYTTLVLAEACVRNREEGFPVHYRAFDPFAGVAAPPPPGLDELALVRAQDVPAEVFESLGEGDLLVVDTTHTVKIGGDVNFVVLDILPRLRPGVVVHFHDIFLPWEYPRAWLEDYGLFWSEQYLLQAFLALNRDYEVICALHALSRAYPERLAPLIPSWDPGAAPGAFWIRRRPAG